MGQIDLLSWTFSRVSMTDHSLPHLNESNGQISDADTANQIDEKTSLTTQSSVEIMDQHSGEQNATQGSLGGDVNVYTMLRDQ